MRSGQTGADQVRPERQPEQERGAGADDNEPTHVAPFAATEELLHLGAGEKHQQ